MISKILTLLCVCALALTACNKKETKKASDDTSKAAKSMAPAKGDAMGGDAMGGDAMGGDAMRAAAMGQFDAKATALQVLKMQAMLTELMVAALPDCDKSAAVANSLLDKPKWSKLAATIKANSAAVRAAQKAVLTADRTKGGFMRGRIKVMVKCKGNPRHIAFAKRLTAMWQ